MVEHKNEPGRYSLAFTSGGLLAREAVVVATIYLECRDWGVTRKHLIEKNALQARAQSSSARIGWEVVQRLKALSDEEITLLVDATLTERGYLMWAATCRRYELIGDFAEEVLREHFLLLKPTVTPGDLERFMTAKSLWHPEIEELKPSTTIKLRQVLFRMMHEADLLTEGGEIVPALLSERVYETLAAHTPSDIRYFPTTLPVEVGQ